MILSINSSSTHVTEFLMICFPGMQNIQHWLSIPLTPLLVLALGANVVLLLTIQREASLHEPMYYLMAILSILDIIICLTVIPKVLLIFWFNMKSISFTGCFLQMFVMNTFLPMESSTFLIMAYDRYIAICHPLHYPSIITEQFVVKAAIFIIFRNLFVMLPTPILAARLDYCAGNVIENCICANISVARLSCGDIHLNKLYQFVSIWCLMGSDMVLILLSYCFILRTVLKLQSEGAATKALSTCGSHLILILFLYTILLVFIFTNKAGKKVPAEVPILLNVLHHLIPPALNPIVYGVRTQEIKHGILKLLKYQK
ncbi:olfactory receptor 56A4-like [Sarcophilus harrisii]|uniref:G-protein coupled receptors family 1 profile domain-containing protein n=1 Tax=Sarcophilus harrisii TaxID=9305 RepID=A0A7N4NSJ6_SARHA|nr:olfactory receptor 56A4-like [Sarcophilus harrisii]